MNKQRIAPIEVNPDNFRAIGHHLVDRIADFLDSLPTRPVTTGEAPPAIRDALDSNRLIPDLGTDPATLLDRSTDLFVRPLALQQSSTLLGLHHCLRRTDWNPW